jgi:O-antigen ligase
VRVTAPSRPGGRWPAGLAAAVGGWYVLTGSPLAVLAAAALVTAALLLAAADAPLALACAGLVTMSWDRVSAEIGPMTLKPAYVAFALALALEVLRGRPHPPAGSLPRPHPPASAGARGRLALLQAAVAGMLVLFAAATLAGGHLRDGLRQGVVVLVGAILPAVVLYRIGRSPERRATALRWAVGGAAATAVVGIYQFASTYLPLPGVLTYTGRAQGLGRTAGLSFEPAFFASYLLLFVPLALGAAGRRRGPVAVTLVLGVLLANSRAGYLGLVVVLGALLVAPRLAGLAGRAAAGARARLVGLVAVVGLAVMALSLAAGFHPHRFLQARVASVADPTEASSNAPRLRLYAVAARVAADHPLLGIGPGALGQVLPRYGLSLPEYYQFSPPPGGGYPAWGVVANNIWLQSALDAGVLAVAGTGLVVAGIWCLARRGEDGDARLLALGCLAVVAVGGLFTSVLWDVEVWALLGLALAADAVPASGAAAGPGPHAGGPARRRPSSPWPPRTP